MKKILPEVEPRWKDFPLSRDVENVVPRHGENGEGFPADPIFRKVYLQPGDAPNGPSERGFGAVLPLGSPLLTSWRFRRFPSSDNKSPPAVP